mgnify:CR=1 FL=1
MVVGWKDADHGAYSAFWWCKDLVPLSDLTNLCISLISHSSKVNTWCRKDLFHFIHCFNVAVSRFHWPLVLDHKTERDSACSLLYCKFLIYLLTPPFLPHFSFFPVAHKWKLAELVIAALISSLSTLFQETHIQKIKYSIKMQRVRMNFWILQKLRRKNKHL